MWIVWLKVERTAMDGYCPIFRLGKTDLHQGLARETFFGFF